MSRTSTRTTRSRVLAGAVVASLGLTVAACGRSSAGVDGPDGARGSASREAVTSTVPYVAPMVESAVPPSAEAMAAMAAWVGVVEVVEVQTIVTPIGSGEERAMTFWRVRALDRRNGDIARPGVFSIFTDTDDRLVGDARRSWQPASGQRFIVALAAGRGPDGSAEWSSPVSFLPLDPDLAHRVAEARRASLDPEMAAFGEATLGLDPQDARRSLLTAR